MLNTDQGKTRYLIKNNSDKDTIFLLICSLIEAEAIIDYQLKDNKACHWNTLCHPKYSFVDSSNYIDVMRMSQSFDLLDKDISLIEKIGGIINKIYVPTKEKNPDKKEAERVLKEIAKNKYKAKHKELTEDAKEFILNNYPDVEILYKNIGQYFKNNPKETHSNNGDENICRYLSTDFFNDCPKIFNDCLKKCVSAATGKIKTEDDRNRKLRTIGAIFSSLIEFHLEKVYSDNKVNGFISAKDQITLLK